MLALITFSLLVSNYAHAKDTCIFFVGDGSFLMPRMEERFQEKLQAMEKKWSSSCSEKTFLISIGSKTILYSPQNKTYKSPSIKIDGPATSGELAQKLKSLQKKLNPGDQVRLYFGDHGDIDGTVTAKENLTPTQLKEMIKPLAQKNIKVRGVFDQCYAGLMQDAFYDLGKDPSVYGCGISGSNNYYSWGTSLNQGKEKLLPECTANNQSFCTLDATGSDDLRHHFISTSDRFLSEYAKNNIHQQCDLTNMLSILPKELQKVKATLQQSDFVDIKTEIETLNQNYSAALENFKKLRTSALFDKKQTQTFEQITELESELYLAANTGFKKWISKDPKENTFYQEYLGVRKNIETCLETAPDSTVVQDCAEYTRYIELNKKYQDIKESYRKKTLVKDVLAKNSSFFNCASKTILDCLDEFNQMEWDAQTIEIKEEKLALIKKKQLALVTMLKNKDLKAIQVWRKLKSCEFKTIL